MKLKIFKKISFFCLTFILIASVFSPNTFVYAATDDGDKDCVYNDVATVSDKSTVLTRGNFLNYGTVTLTRIDIMKVRITGDTAAHRVCDILGLDLFLEKSSDGINFESYRQWEFSKQNDSFFWKGLELIVPSGYWYRLKGGHIAIIGNDGESVVTMTDGLYVY